MLSTKPIQPVRFNEQIDQVSQSLKDEFEGLSADQLNWKPDASTWSIAQNLDHLIVINESYFPIFADIKSGNFKPPFIARFGFITRFLGNSILKSVRPETQKKIKTFSIWEPSQSEIEGDILNRFLDHQKKLNGEISSLESYADAGLIICSPANKHIAYPLKQAFDIILTHEMRHLKQAKQIKEKINQNSTH